MIKDSVIHKQYIKAYTSIYREWNDGGREDFFVEWTADKYGVQFKVSSAHKMITDITILDEKKFFWFAIKHSS